MVKIFNQKFLFVLKILLSMHFANVISNVYVKIVGLSQLVKCLKVSFVELSSS